MSASFLLPPGPGSPASVLTAPTAPAADRSGVGSFRPPSPDRRAWVLLLVFALAAALSVGLPPPAAHAGTDGAPAAAPAPAGPVLAPGGGRAWPVGDRSGLLGRFDAPPVKWAAGHRGVDLAASPGTPVRAAAAGVVTFSGVVAGRPVVTVTHPGSGSPPLRTTYLPVAGTVPVGTAVAAGATIGEVAAGSGHCADGCLHWGLLRGSRYLDPLALLGNGRARLLPLDGPAPRAVL